MPEISIVIPSRNNRERLAATLESARRLELDPSRFEVLVEDDGSTDGTLEAFRERRYPFRFEIARGEHGNQSAATNAAAARARGRYLLCAASDLVFDPQLLTRHLEMHARHGEREVAVLGHLPYLPQLAERPFMHYLMHGGPQFGYTQIRDPRRLGPNFCYAPNLSLRREVYERVGGFDPYFRYGGQDTDLGYRLVAAGVRLVYEPEAVAWHDHPADPEGYRARQRAAGSSSALLAERYPELEGGAPLWDAVVGAWLIYPDAMLDRDRRLIEALEPRVAAGFPEYQRLWSEVGVRQAVEPDALDDPQRELFVTTRSLYSAYERLNRHWWAEAFVEESLRRTGAQRVAAWIDGRLLKRQTTLQARRVAERRLASIGIERTLVDPADVQDSLVIDEVRGYDDALALVAGALPPQEGRFNRELLLVAPAGALDDEQRRRLAEVVELVECDGAPAGLLAALRRCRGEHVTVRAGRIDDETPDARWVVERLFRRLPELKVISGEGPEADSIVPLPAASPAHWSVRREDAVRLGAAAARLAGLRGETLQSAVAGLLGGQVCHVPGLVQEKR